MQTLRKTITAALACICAIVSANAQESAITGTVSGSDGEILTGATLVAGGGAAMHLPTSTVSSLFPSTTAKPSSCHISDMTTIHSLPPDRKI